jgi:hypothetical protein
MKYTGWRPNGFNAHGYDAFGDDRSSFRFVGGRLRKLQMHRTFRATGAASGSAAAAMALVRSSATCIDEGALSFVATMCSPDK